MCRKCLRAKHLAICRGRKSLKYDIVAVDILLAICKDSAGEKPTRNFERFHIPEIVPSAPLYLEVRSDSITNKNDGSGSP